MIDIGILNNELLDIKQKIISNNQYKNWMKRISNIENEFTTSSIFNNKVALDHGIEHMDRVANNIYKLLKEYNVNQATCKLGYIAGLLHDIGMINGKKGHAEQGAKMAKMFLEELNLIDISDIKIIVEAIKNHGDGGNTIDIVSSILAICDKLDMCKKRALGNLSPIQLIENYTVEIKYNTLQISYIMNDLKGKEGLYIIPKSIDIPKTLGKKLGLEVEFYINGNYEEFRDRVDYIGPIYKRKE